MRGGMLVVDATILNIRHTQPMVLKALGCVTPGELALKRLLIALEDVRHETTRLTEYVRQATTNLEMLDGRPSRLKRAIREQLSGSNTQRLRNLSRLLTLLRRWELHTKN